MIDNHMVILYLFLFDVIFVAPAYICHYVVERLGSPNAGTS